MSLLVRLKKAFVSSRQTLLSSHELERAILKRMFLVLVTVIGTIFLIYTLVHIAHGQQRMTWLNGAGFAVALACAGFAYCSGNYAWPMRVLMMSIFALLAMLTLEQGPSLPAAGWWLSIVPFMLAGAGLYYLAIASVFAFIGIVSYLHFGAALAPLGPPLELSVEAWRRYAAIVGSESLALMVIIVAMNARAKVAQALDSARAAAQEAAAIKASFLANMSHEIRTPLTGIIGAAEVLNSAELSDAQRNQLLSMQRQSASTLLALVNDVLDFAKLEAGKMQLESQPVYLRDLVFESNELFSMQAFGKGIELTSSCSPEVARGVFFGDPMRLRQIVNNLVSNAVKFTAIGDVHIHLSLADADPAPEVAGKRMVRISVTDTGPGIAADLLPLLFNPFIQADGSLTRRFAGTGLGLSIAQDLAKLMGGRIEVESSVGQGSTFSLVVPLVTESKDGSLALAARRQDVVLVTTSRGLERHVTSLLRELNVDPRVVGRVPSPQDLAECRALLIDAPLLPRTDPSGWLAGQAQAGRHVAVLTPLGADAVVGAPEGVHLIYKPVRIEALAALLPATDLPVHPAPPEAASSGVALSELRVLVAEDNLVNQVVIQAMLSELGVTSTITDNGRDALNQALEERFDVVLMDVHMPEMDGLSATRELRAREWQRGSHPVTVVAMTARTDHDDEASCFAAGMDGFLPKPFGLAQLRRCLEQMAARQHAA